MKLQLKQVFLRWIFFLLCTAVHFYSCYLTKKKKKAQFSEICFSAPVRAYEFRRFPNADLFDFFYAAFTFYPLMMFYACCCFMIRCLCKKEIIVFTIVL